MKWMDLTLNTTGCTMGIYSRDAVYLHSLPRLTDHVFMGGANRCYQLYRPPKLTALCMMLHSQASCLACA